MQSSVRLSLALLTSLGAAACDDDGPSGPSGPTRAEVAGIYSVCQLTFTPAGTLASVDVRATAIETGSTEVDAPEVRIDQGTAIQLAYTPRGAFVERFVAGTYDLSGSRVTLRFTDAAARNALLLPERAEMTFQSAPKQLTTSGSTAYSVPRARYAELTGQSETNLAPQIEGRLSASLRADGCG